VKNVKLNLFLCLAESYAMKSFKTRWRTVQPVLNLGNRCTFVVSFESPPVDK